jgi:hypothetical protein
LAKVGPKGERRTVSTHARNISSLYGLLERSLTVGGHKLCGESQVPRPALGYPFDVPRSRPKGECP